MKLIKIKGSPEYWSGNAIYNVTEAQTLLDEGIVTRVVNTSPIRRRIIRKTRYFYDDHILGIIINQKPPITTINKWKNTLKRVVRWEDEQAEEYLKCLFLKKFNITL
jgi:hypothetical protein